MRSRVNATALLSTKNTEVGRLADDMAIHCPSEDRRGPTLQADRASYPAHRLQKCNGADWRQEADTEV